MFVERIPLIYEHIFKKNHTSLGFEFQILNGLNYQLLCIIQLMCFNGIEYMNHQIKNIVAVLLQNCKRFTFLLFFF